MLIEFFLCQSQLKLWDKLCSLKKDWQECKHITSSIFFSLFYFFVKNGAAKRIATHHSRAVGHWPPSSCRNGKGATGTREPTNYSTVGSTSAIHAQWSRMCQTWKEGARLAVTFRCNNRSFCVTTRSLWWRNLTGGSLMKVSWWTDLVLVLLTIIGKTWIKLKLRWQTAIASNIMTVVKTA